MADSAFSLLVSSVFLGVPVYARVARGRTYAIFAAIILGVSLPGLLITHARFVAWLPVACAPWLNALFAAGIAAAGVHMAHLVRARMRSRWFRWGVSIPGQTTVAAGFLLGLWLLVLLPIRLLLPLLGWEDALVPMRWLDVLPIVVALVSIRTSSRPALEVVRGRAGDEAPTEITRLPIERHRGPAPPPLPDRPLRIVQIADPHLGPWQTVRALQATLERLLATEPDLVLLTGDFLTMESSGAPDVLVEALAPLRARATDCYAIFGNHDHDAPDVVRAALRENGIQLLVDQEAVAVTAAGPVQLIGADYVGRGRRAHIQGLLQRYPRRAGHLRLLLLHDPLGFQCVPPGQVDLTLSGHTHGGQLGLVSLGLEWTVLSRSRWPDHGLFGLGSNRLYVHRGTGFYGFPLRVGVPGEASVLEWVVDRGPQAIEPVVTEAG